MNDLFPLVSRWLKMLKIDTALSRMHLLLASHPDKHSLQAISDTFDELGIPNIVLEIGNENIFDLPLPFLTLTRKGYNQDYRIVRMVNKDSIEFQDSNGDMSQQLLPDFFREWSSIVMVAEETTQNNGRKTDLTKIVSIIFIAAGMLLSVGMVAFYSENISIVILMILAIAGLITSGFISQYEIGYAGARISKFCNSGKNNDCKVVLQSAGATVGAFGLGDLSIGFFSTWIIILCLMVGRVDSAALTGSLTLVGMTAVPVTFYSLGYQYLKVKVWCRLCLCITGILWTQALLLGINLNGFVWDVKTAVAFAVVFMATLMLWHLLKQKLVAAHKLPGYEIKALKFARNYHLFIPFLEQQPAINTRSFSNEITMGNRSAPVQLIIVANPFCDPCAFMHGIYLELIRKHPDDICLCYRFKVHMTGDVDDKGKFLLSLMTIRYEKGNAAALLALDDWFQQMDYLKWEYKQEGISGDQVVAFAQEHAKWVIDNKIQRTPALLINGKMFPDFYDPEEITQLIPYIVHYYQNNEQPLGSHNV